MVGLEKSNEQLKNDYLAKAKALGDWINDSTNEMKDRSLFHCCLDIDFLLQRIWTNFGQHQQEVG